MALTQSQVSALYVAIFGRASEGEANKKWQKSASLIDVAKEMLKSDEAKKLFGTSLDSDKAFIDFIYANVLGKGAGIDQAGKDFWINKLKAGSDKAAIMSDIIHAAMDTKYASSSDTATKNAFNLFVNKVALSNIVSEAVEKLPEGGLKALQEINKAVKPATKVAEVKNLITANETLKSAVDTTKLEKAATANDPAKVIASVTGAKVEEISKILKENPVDSADSSSDSGSTGSGSGGSETPTVTIAQADLANTAATNLKIADSAANIQGALATLVANKEKVASINASDDGSEIEMTKTQFDALKDKLTDNNDTIKVTDLAAGDVATAENVKVDSFTMNGGNKLTVTAAQAEALKTKAGNDSLAVSDTAENIKNALDNLVANVAKVASINASDDGSEIEMTKTQFDALKDKLTDNNDTIKVTDLAAGDVATAENVKVDSFTMNGGNKLTVTAAQAEALKTKAGAATDVFAVSDTASNIKNALADLVTNVDKVASIAANDSNTITVNAEQLTALKGKVSDNALDVEGKGTELKATLVALSDSELAKIKNASIDLKGEAAGDDGEIELTLAQFVKLGTKFSGTTGTDTITVTGVTGEVAASAAKDVFKLDVAATGLNITGFTHDTDKVNVKAIAGEAAAFEAATATNAGATMATNKAYYVDGSAIDTSGLGDSFNATTAGFDKLFATTGKAFKTTVTGATTALLAVKVDADTIQLYKIDSNGDSTATDITATDLTLVGSVTGATIDSSDFLFA